MTAISKDDPDPVWPEIPSLWMTILGTLAVFLTIGGLTVLLVYTLVGDS